MGSAVYLSLALGALFGVLAPPLGRRLPPVVNTWLLSTGSVLAAGASTASLALLAATLVSTDSKLAALGHWSRAALSRSNPVPTVVAVLAALALAVLTGRCAATVVRRLAAVTSARRLAAALPCAGGELVVVDDPDRLAYAVPGRPGRIVVSTGLLRGLSAPQRRAVLTHERTHLTHRHHLHVAVAELARTANPLLWAVPAAVRLSTERWADEAAAASTPRAQVAEALLQAATGRTSTTAGARRFASSAVLAAALVDVEQRVQALRAPAPQLRVWRVALVVALLCATAFTTLHAAYDTDNLFDHARAVYNRR